MSYLMSGYVIGEAAGGLIKSGGQIAKGTLNTGVLDNANFAQKTYSSTFSKDGIKIYSDLSGKPIIQLMS